LQQGTTPVRNASEVRHVPDRQTDTDALQRHIANRLALRRVEINLTRQELGDRLGCSTTLVEQWESGRHRIDALTIWQVAAALQTSVSYFFSDEGPAQSPPDVNRPEREKAQASRPLEPESIALAKLFQSIRDAHTRTVLLDLITSVAARPPRPDR
jgi:transcriptional regulator with XRE-family HTH domain